MEWRTGLPSTVHPLLPEPESDAASDRTQALLVLAEQLLQAGTPRAVAASLVEAVVTTYGFPRVAVVVRRSGGLAALALHGAVTPAPGVGSSAAVERACELSATQVLPRLDASTEPWLVSLLPPGSDLLVVPLRARGRALGGLVLQIPTALRGTRGRRMLTEVERCARYAALALHRVQRPAPTQRAAARHELALVALRRTFLALLEREVARCARRGEPVSLVLLDIDGFKQVNDVYGWTAGDAALREVAAALTLVCHDLSTTPQYHGEEFAVILPHCDAERSVVLSDRLRAAVHAAPAAVRLAASAGVATWPTHGHHAEQLVQAADAAFLEAKRSGRDRTSTPPGSWSRARPGEAWGRETPARTGAG